jgi:LuxR family maltose regulon positive regulatory protein
MIELLRTKFYIPRHRKNLVSRPRLVDRLNAGLEKELTLIAAPVGFGKTTLLSEWIPQSPRCVTWLSLEDDDNDPTRFWTYFISSLQRLRPDLGAGTISLLQSSPVPPAPAILTTLINDLAAFPDPFATVLDDYHVIHSQPIHEAVGFLIDHMPANMNLVMTTRVDPPLGLGRLRALDRLTELRASDLRFSPAEAADFLTQVVGLRLTMEEVEALEARTEGWIAGLQIAGLSMQGHDDLPGFIRAFSGSHRHILGYLAEEVLAHQPEATLKFLIQTSILNRLCVPLCDAVMENREPIPENRPSEDDYGSPSGFAGSVLGARPSSQAILESLDQANLFITPLDDEGRWFRYHPLFAEVLQNRLQRTGRDPLRELHQRAGAWYAQQGMLDEAIHHELAGVHFEQAALLIEQAAGMLLRKGMSSSLIRWLKALPDETIRTQPRLCLVCAWTSLLGPAFSLERADEWVRLALQGVAPGEVPEPELEGEVLALKALIAADRVELALSRELAHRALELLPAGSPWRGVTTFCLGSALFAAGEWSEASPVLTEALQLSQAEGALYTQLIAASFLADIQAAEGHLGRAMEIYRQVLAWSDHGIPQKGALVAHAGLANVLCEQDRLDAALAHVQSGINQLEQVGGPGAALWLYRALARVQQARGNWAGALDALNQAYQRGQAAQIPFVMAQAAALRARVHLTRGDLEAAADWAAASGLDPQDPQASQAGLREMEYLTLARVLTARGYHQESLGLLERLAEMALTNERLGSAVEILALQALALQAQGNLPRALMCLERALTLAEPEGFVRTFVDEGEPMYRLILAVQSILKTRIRDGVENDSLRLWAYTGQLLAACPRGVADGEPGSKVLLEPLSERELGILQLIASGHTNQEIADILVIAVSTVKSHINHLYSKLGTNRRTQAIAIARDAGLLSE